MEDGHDSFDIPSDVAHIKTSFCDKEPVAGNNAKRLRVPHMDRRLAMLNWDGQLFGFAGTVATLAADPTDHDAHRGKVTR
jgi:hypothetical protein